MASAVAQVAAQEHEGNQEEEVTSVGGHDRAQEMCNVLIEKWACLRMVRVKLGC